MLGGQSLAGCADGAEHVHLASAADRRTLGAADLDDAFAGILEEGGEAGAEAAGAFEYPAAAAGHMRAGEVEKALVAAVVDGGVGGLQEGADGADGCCGEGVAVSIDSDDAVDVFCKHGHAFVVLLRADGRGRRRPGWSHHVAEL
ncbi:hypothetical protein [Streptomyces sp. NBC_00076]|uniref:hypothetical protein n=1 Tax=Streptomyces sp. NBC_00076 TaxID=2975642 RepID=UPI003250FAD0